MVTAVGRRVGPTDVAAFAAIYGIWGSTYLGVKLAIASIPPFTMTAARAFLAGAILYGWGRWRGAPAPTSGQWMGGAAVGAAMFFGAHGGVAWAEQRVPSGVAALIVATVPLWMAVLEIATHRAATVATRGLVGIVLGMAGILLLVGPRSVLAGEPVDALGAIVLVGAALSWSVGSALSRRVPRPVSLTVTNGTYLLTGAAMLLVAGAVRGELHAFDVGAVTQRSLAALAYLVVFGSVVAFGAYSWLLRRRSLTAISTYAFVNPIVAVVLGWAVGGEALDGRVLAAAALVVGAVVLILTARTAEAGRGVRAARTVGRPKRTVGVPQGAKECA